MKKPIYIRDGSRFRRIDYYTGMFWNLDGSFTDVEKDNSIGIVVSQDGNEVTIASLKPSLMDFTWNMAISYCRAFSPNVPVKCCYLPTRSELLSAIDKFEEYLYHENHSGEWTSTECHNPDLAWELYWHSSGYIANADKNHRCYARRFYKVEI